MTPRCTQCGWRFRDADELHGTLECVVYLASRLKASRAVIETRAPRSVDVRETRKALRDVIAMAGAS